MSSNNTFSWFWRLWGSQPEIPASTSTPDPTLLTAAELRRLANAVTNRLTNPANAAELTRECDAGLQHARDTYLAALLGDLPKELPPTSFIYWFRNPDLMEFFRQHYTERGFSVVCCPYNNGDVCLTITW